jgi:hypothetical protein
LRAEGQGKPLVFMLTGGECHEQSVFESPMECGAVRRLGRGSPRGRPKLLVDEKGYSIDEVRGYLSRRRIGVVIARMDRRSGVPWRREGWKTKVLEKD